jgi:hypothetical protein
MGAKYAVGIKSILADDRKTDQFAGVIFVVIQ